MIESLDDSVGEISTTLRDLGLSDDTLVVFYSDNGPYGPITSSAPLRGSKGMLYEGGIRVPLIMRWDGVIAPGMEIDVPVIGTDLFPTFLEAAGSFVRDDSLETDGVSIWPVLEGAANLPHRTLVWHFPAYLEAYPGDPTVVGPWRTSPAAAIRVGNYKLIEFFEGGVLELYDLETDIGESVNLVNENRELANSLHRRLINWREELNAPMPLGRNPEFAPGSIIGSETERK